MGHTCLPWTSSVICFVQLHHLAQNRHSTATPGAALPSCFSEDNEVRLYDTVTLIFNGAIVEESQTAPTTSDSSAAVHFPVELADRGESQLSDCSFISRPEVAVFSNNKGLKIAQVRSGRELTDKLPVLQKPQAGLGQPLRRHSGTW